MASILNQIPLNLELLQLSEQDLRSLSRIEVLDIFTPSTRNFHPKGLFSIDIFGKVGEERRNRLLAYIDMKVDIFHPVLFKSIYDLKALYGDILSGKEYAIFDTTINDFVKSDIVDGDTGYAFFCKHFSKITFEQRPSTRRQFNIDLINKHRETPFIKQLLVMPAGLRDYVIDEDGKPSEDEINTLYRKVLSIASVIDNVNAQYNEEYLDTARFNLQIAVNDIYNYIKNLLEGKNKFIQGKWVSRKIFNSTRNVITSYLHDSPVLFGERSVSANQSVVGLYQFLRAIFPLAVKLIRDGFLSKVFIGPNSPALLVNKKTLHKESVTLDSIYFDEWMTIEGLEKVFARFGQDDLRHDILEIDTHYFGLIYKGPDQTYRFMQDIDELPEGRLKEHVYPLTFVELLYLSVYEASKEIPCLITRYPITGYGSIYPSYIYLRTTNNAESRTELDEQWALTTHKAIEYPVKGEQFYLSLAMHNSHAPRLGADFDGKRSLLSK